jgi:ABC-type spermidine/putrescine transport system permease subunit II
MRGKRLSGGWLRVAAAALLAAVMAAPAAIIYPLSVSSSRFFEPQLTALSARWFASFLTPYWLNAAFMSAIIAFAASAIATAVAAPAAFYRFRWKSGAAGWLVDFGAAAALLIPAISLAVGYFRVYGEGGIRSLMLGHTLLAFPFPYFALRGGFASVEPDVADAAELLGAADLDTMLRVLLPSLKRFILLGLVLAFLVSWDETVLSVFITSPETVTLPKAVWENMHRERDLTPAAINTVIAPLLSLTILKLFLSSLKDRAMAKKIVT